MFIKNWKKDILTIPNLLSLFRLFLVPVYVSLYLNASEQRHYYAAGIILAVSCLTDALDGHIARRCNMITTLGKILDPLADKVTQFALTLCLSLRYPVLKPVLILFVGKELIQTLLGLVHLHRGKMLAGALPVGKLCTAVLFVSLTILVLFPGIQISAIRAIALTDSIFLLISFIGYLSVYFGRSRMIQDME